MPEPKRAYNAIFHSVSKKAGSLCNDPVDQTGYFVGPTVFVDIQPHHRLAQEEIFGPVLAVMKAESMARCDPFGKRNRLCLDRRCLCQESGSSCDGP